MKLKLNIILFLLVSLVSACQPHGNPNTPVAVVPTPITGALTAELNVTKIEDGVYRFTHSLPWPANSLLVEMKNGEILLIDTPYTPEATQIVLDWVQTSFGARKVTAVVTGYHVDNLGGIQVLTAAGIPVYGSDLTANLVVTQEKHAREMILSFLNPDTQADLIKIHQTIPYLPPTETFSLTDGLTLTFGEERVEIIYPGPSHAEDNVVVYLPDRKGLFGGCMVLAGEKPGNTLDANMEVWPESIRALQGLDLAWIIPGHGERYDTDLLEHTLFLLSQN